MSGIKINDSEYLIDKTKIKDTIRINQNKAMMEVNIAMILTYHEIGTIINQRSEYGDNYIEKLAEDLKEYGKGYTLQNLTYMSRFSLMFTKKEIINNSIIRIPWSYTIEILDRCDSHDEMLWYILQTIKNGWSKSTLLLNIGSKMYENIIKK